MDYQTNQTNKTKKSTDLFSSVDKQAKTEYNGIKMSTPTTTNLGGFNSSASAVSKNTLSDSYKPAITDYDSEKMANYLYNNSNIGSSMEL